MNGPCGVSNKEVRISPEIDCAWQLIYERLKVWTNWKAAGDTAPKDWSHARDGGVRKMARRIDADEG